MEPKSKTEKQPPKGGTTNPSPDSVLKALIGAGYKPVRGFGRKGNRVTFHLKSAKLAGKDGNFRALETCAAMGLQAECRTHPAVPEPILIVEVNLKAND